MSGVRESIASRKVEGDEGREQEKGERGESGGRGGAASDALIHADIRLRLQDLLECREPHDLITDVRPLPRLPLSRGGVAAVLARGLSSGA